MATPDANSYKSFADLGRNRERGKDYEIVVLNRPASRIAVIAPHGGAIEQRTSEIARAIAGDDFHLYLFEGIRSSENYSTLHLTSHFFDEPECLALIERCPFVVAIHGCKGTDERVLLGGLDVLLKRQLAIALRNVNVMAQTDSHDFTATNPNNICNRGLARRGVQLEFTGPLRGAAAEGRAVSAIRSVLTSLNISEE